MPSPALRCLAEHSRSADKKEMDMSRTRKFTLIRLANAKALTQGPEGDYAETNAIRQEKPGDI